MPSCLENEHILCSSNAFKCNILKGIRFEKGFMKKKNIKESEV
jgi:hypothetical protein